MAIVTTAETDAAAVFDDAQDVLNTALAQLVAGDLRDAAEKAWCATVRATEALILNRTGEESHTSTTAGRRLREASESDSSLRDLRLHYLERQTVLHGDCFYHGYCDPGETERLIRETAGYIEDARRLAAA